MFVMQAVETDFMPLEKSNLSEIDQIILSYLREGRVTPVFVREKIIDEGERESISEQYCGQRLRRLEEHDHVVNLYDTGLYELTDDPESTE